MSAPGGPANVPSSHYHWQRSVATGSGSVSRQRPPLAEPKRATPPVPLADSERSIGIRVATLNIGGAGRLGAEHHWGYLCDAVRPGGPLASRDLIFLTEVKLTDFTLLRHLGRLLHLALHTTRDDARREREPLAETCPCGAPRCNKRVKLLAMTSTSTSKKATQSAPMCALRQTQSPGRGSRGGAVSWRSRSTQI